ncbi:MAG: DUF4339 domain-containing protein [Flavobacterium sp.]|nr:DUF4339 domain-containing protein [Flavobacterium sp.]
MKKYYIEINGQQSEPLSLEELKKQKITKETLVWFEGQDDWIKAGNIQELEVIFKSIPPPIKKVTPPPVPIMKEQVVPAPQYMHEKENKSFFSTVQGKILMGIAAVGVVVVLLFSFTDKSHLEVQTQTELNTEQLQQQQQLLDEQNAKIAEQQRIEAERQERERKAAIRQQIQEISEQLNIAYQNVEKAKQGLNDASAFQLLRSKSERNQQINEATDALNSWTNEVQRLEGELNTLNKSL